MLKDAEEAQPQTADWHGYWQAIREKLWVIVLCLVLGGIGTAIYRSRQEARYQARSVIFLEQETEKVLKDVETVRKESIGSMDMINTVVDLLRSYPFAERVAQRMKLDEDARFKASIPTPLDGKITVQHAAGALVFMVNVQYRRATRLIDIFVTHPDPAMATSLANAYAEEYVRFVLEKRTEASRTAQHYLLEEAETLRRKMRVSEEALQSFRERERAPSLDNVRDGMQLKLKEQEVRLAEIEQKMFQLDTDLKVARANAGNADALLRLPSVADEPKVAQLVQALAAQDRQVLLVNERYRAKHPIYITARTQREAVSAELNSVLRNSVSLLEAQRASLQNQYDEIKKAREEQETRLLAITGKSVEYNDLNRELAQDTVMHQNMLSRIKEIDVTKGLTDSPVRVHEHATGAALVGVTPIKAYAIGIFAGLASGLGLILGMQTLDQSVKTVDQAEQITGLHVLAAVPRKKKTKKNRGERSLEAVSDRQGTIAESFRSLRASLAMVANAEARRSFLFTSPMPAEGKTFCSTNFAITLSQQGFRTLLIDADLRKPVISRIFFGEERTPGLTDILSGQVAFDEAVNVTDQENLSILAAGTRAPNPAELIATKGMRDVIAKALTSFDRVVVDTAPVLAVSDTFLIVPHVDVCCLVVRAQATSRKAVLRAVKALAEIKCRPAGMVLNSLPTGSGSNYYYSAKYSGSYGSKGVYGAKS